MGTEKAVCVPPGTKALRTDMQCHPNCLLFHRWKLMSEWHPVQSGENPGPRLPSVGFYFNHESSILKTVVYLLISLYDHPCLMV